MNECSLSDTITHALNVMKVFSSLPGLVMELGLGLPGRRSWQSKSHTASMVCKRACSRCYRNVILK